MGVTDVELTNIRGDECGVHARNFGELEIIQIETVDTFSDDDWPEVVPGEAKPDIFQRQLLDIACVNAPGR